MGEIDLGMGSLNVKKMMLTQHIESAAMDSQQGRRGVWQKEEREGDEKEMEMERVESDLLRGNDAKEREMEKVREIVTEGERSRESSMGNHLKWEGAFEKFGSWGKYDRMWRDEKEKEMEMERREEELEIEEKRREIDVLLRFGEKGENQHFYYDETDKKKRERNKKICAIGEGKNECDGGEGDSFVDKSEMNTEKVCNKERIKKSDREDDDERYEEEEESELGGILSHWKNGSDYCAKENLNLKEKMKLFDWERNSSDFRDNKDRGIPGDLRCKEERDKDKEREKDRKREWGGHKLMAKFSESYDFGEVSFKINLDTFYLTFSFGQNFSTSRISPAMVVHGTHSLLESPQKYPFLRATLSV